MSNEDDENKSAEIHKLFGVVQGNKKPEFPAYPYVITDIDDVEHYYDGYLIFTTHHVCIMVEGPDQEPVTGFLIPMHRVKDVSIAEEEEITVN